MNTETRTKLPGFTRIDGSHGDQYTIQVILDTGEKLGQLQFDTKKQVKIYILGIINTLKAQYNIAVSTSQYKALKQYCDDHLTTPEGQLAYWIAVETGASN